MNTNPKITRIALNAVGGGFTDIKLTIVASKVEVMEDPAVNDGAPQGLTGFYTDTQPATGFPNVGNQENWLPQTAGQRGYAFQPIVFGGIDGRVDGGHGGYVGAQGTVVLRLSSLTVTTTTVILAEWA